MQVLSDRFNLLGSRLEAACIAAGRAPAEVTLLAVGKQHPASAIAGLYQLGQRHFGENRLQEARGKQQALSELPDLQWHFIGPLQSNKAREVAGCFHWVQSVDRLKTLERLAEGRAGTAASLNICLQVNIDAEAQKAGADPAQLEALAVRAAELPGLRLRGLMCIPEQSPDAQRLRDSFRRCRLAFEKLRRLFPDLDTLSMGMSADLEHAIAEGSTMVRVGSDLFGPRSGGHTGL